MKKIPTLFKRDTKTHLVIDEINPGTEWVIAEEGESIRKVDGTCCLLRDRKLYKRYTLKRNNKPPEGFEPVTDIDLMTGKQEGWLPVTDSKEDQWHREALENVGLVPDGTYELCGPKVQGNPEGFQHHLLISHKLQSPTYAPLTFNLLKEFFTDNDIEGIVWHHPDGRMVKIKGKDFGIKRKRFWN